MLSATASKFNDVAGDGAKGPIGIEATAAAPPPRCAPAGTGLVAGIGGEGTERPLPGVGVGSASATSARLMRPRACGSTRRWPGSDSVRATAAVCRPSGAGMKPTDNAPRTRAVTVKTIRPRTRSWHRVPWTHSAANHQRILLRGPSSRFLWVHDRLESLDGDIVLVGRRARRTCHHHPHSERRDGDHHSEGAVHRARLAYRWLVRTDLGGRSSSCQTTISHGRIKLFGLG